MRQETSEPVDYITREYREVLSFHETSNYRTFTCNVEGVLNQERNVIAFAESDVKCYKA
jgi:hypothetical protein